eukprot:11616880-Prorocentrum_lima.AAC.1
MEEAGTNKSRMVIGGIVPQKNKALMMLSIADGRNETLTTTDIANALINAPISKDKTILVVVPKISA